MTFPNPTQLSKMSEPELHSEIELRMDGMWEKPENRIRIDEVYKELNRRGRRVSLIPYETTKNRLGQRPNPEAPYDERQSR